MNAYALAAGLALAILRYIPRFFAQWLAIACVWILSPVLALPCFVRMADETEVTGYPSMLPGQLREFLVPWLMWAQTFDAPLDEWWLAGHGQGSWLRSHFTDDDYKTNGFLRWWCRVLWLCRNPAFGVAQAFGYDQRSMTIAKMRDEDVLWKSGVPNLSYWIVTNARGQFAFCLDWQGYYYKNWCIEVSIGWALFRKDPDQRCMLNVRFIPFRRYG